MRKYTKEILEPIVKASTSISDVLKLLGVKQAGGSHSHISKVIKNFGLNTDHFIRYHNKGIKIGPKHDIDDYLSNKKRITSHNLRIRLISCGLKENKCEKCGINKWFDVDISLELHHIDENHHNNNLSNLLILCPNCHTIHHILNKNAKKENLCK